MLDISAVILTGNEELHIKRCLDRICPLVKEVFIIDCFSKDRTLEIVRSLTPNPSPQGEGGFEGYTEDGCKITVLQNAWVNYATQFNWALDNAPIKTAWTLRLDADEYLCEDLVEELKEKLDKEPEDVTGISFLLRRVWMGRAIRRGLPPIRQMRLFRTGKARSEVRQMDEHIELLEGHGVDYNGEWADDNLNNISWWTQKHVGYSIREATDLLDIEYDLTGAGNEDDKRNITADARAKRMRKHSYAKKPLFLRSFAYFCYRYFFRLGFLEGKEGFMWHFFQGWWYRSLVDAKVFEAKKACGITKEKTKAGLSAEDKAALREFIQNEWKIKI